MKGIFDVIGYDISVAEMVKEEDKEPFMWIGENMIDVMLLYNEKSLF